MAVLLLAAGAPRVAAASLGCLLAGLALGHARMQAIDAAGERFVPGARLAGRAHLLTPPREGRFGTSAEIRLVSAGRASGARLVARFPAWARLPAAVRAGDELAIAGTARPATAAQSQRLRRSRLPPAARNRG